LPFCTFFANLLDIHVSTTKAGGRPGIRCFDKSRATFPCIRPQDRIPLLHRNWWWSSSSLCCTPAAQRIQYVIGFNQQDSIWLSFYLVNFCYNDSNLFYWLCEATHFFFLRGATNTMTSTMCYSQVARPYRLLEVLGPCRQCTGQHSTKSI
jgi:hypothetical protein